MRIPTGRSIAIMCPAFSTRRHDRWPRWYPRSKPICGRPPPGKVFVQCFDQIACAHMSGLLMRSHMNAGQDGFRDTSSKQTSDLMGGHWV
jgi:hypothetical protein